MLSSGLSAAILLTGAQLDTPSQLCQYPGRSVPVVFASAPPWADDAFESA